MREDEVAGIVWRHATGLFHGAVLGAEVTGRRDVLRVDVGGHASPLDAYRSMVRAEPRLGPLHVTSDAMSGVTYAEMPWRAVVTRVRDKRTGSVEVEVRVGGRALEHRMTDAALEDLVNHGALAFESGSGVDPGLACVYDHYVTRRAA